MRSLTRSSGCLAVVAALAVSGCSRADTRASDTAAGDTSPVATMDTGMAGMDHSQMSTSPARDADQEFLRMMVDHHQGLIDMTDTALTRNLSGDAASKGRQMRQKQATEQKDMQAMLKSDYNEDKMPMVMESNKRMISDVASASDVNRMYQEKVIAHHEEALKMTNDIESRLTKPAVRAMAQKMKADQQKEIAELRSKLGKS
jgi:uncharacterized protein (DUF305 family)